MKLNKHKIYYELYKRTKGTIEQIVSCQIKEKKEKEYAKTYNLETLNSKVYVYESCKKKSS